MERPDLLALCLAALPPVAPESLWRAWALAPETLLPLLALLSLPWLLRRRAGQPGPSGGGKVTGAWLFGCALLALALVSPLCRLAAALASAHMLQHLLLVVPAPLALAPLLLRRLGRPRLGPTAATLLLGAAIWAAHAPPVYQRALLDPLAHLALAGLLLGVALLFWTAALAVQGFRALGMVFATLLHSGLLGALLTFSGRLWYPVFGQGPALWGMTPLQDQQLAGLIMWVPMGALLLAVGLWLGLRGLRQLEQPAAASPR